MKVFTNFLEPYWFEDHLTNYKDKPVSIFYEYQPTPDELKLNLYNILIVNEPNELFRSHEYAIQNRNKFNLILSWAELVLIYCKNSKLLPFGSSWVAQGNIDKFWNVDKQFEISFLRGTKKNIIGQQLRWDVYDSKNEIEKILPIKFFDVLNDTVEGRKLDVSEKDIVWNSSMYSIVIENVKHSNWFTEKIIDSFLTNTILIYWGASNIGHYFNTNGIIEFYNTYDLMQQLQTLTPEKYHELESVRTQNYKLALEWGKYFERATTIIKAFIDINKL